MSEDKPAKKEFFQKATGFLIAAFVFVTALVVPGLLALAKKFGWQLPGPLQTLAEMVGVG